MGRLVDLDVWERARDCAALWHRTAKTDHVRLSAEVAEKARFAERLEGEASAAAQRATGWDEHQAQMAATAAARLDEAQQGLTDATRSLERAVESAASVQTRAAAVITSITQEGATRIKQNNPDATYTTTAEEAVLRLEKDHATVAEEASQAAALVAAAVAEERNWHERLARAMGGGSGSEAASTTGEQLAECERCLQPVDPAALLSARATLENGARTASGQRLEAERHHAQLRGLAQASEKARVSGRLDAAARGAPYWTAVRKQEFTAVNQQAAHRVC